MLVAVIGVKGQAVIREGPSGINAQIQFSFLPSEDKAPSAASHRRRDNQREGLRHTGRFSWTDRGSQRCQGLHQQGFAGRGGHNVAAWE